MVQQRADIRTEGAAPAGAAPASGAEAEVLLRIRGLRKSYRGARAVDDVELEIRRGEFFTMLGPSGSGKTTTLRLIAGFERPDAGAITLDGQDVARLAPFERDVNTVFQDYALFPHMTVADNIAYGLRARRVARADIAGRVAEALSMVQLEPFAERLPAQLSGGQRQRVGLARAIVNRPRLLLLDEPLGALDLKLRQDMQVELKQLQKTLGITFLYVTHDQEEALSMSDRIAVFRDGRVEQVDTPQRIYERPASAFVAGFVGSSTILRRGGRDLVLRPEKLRLSDDPAVFDGPEWHCESARVVETIYVGFFTRHILRLDAGETVVALTANSGVAGTGHRPETGSAVHLGWRRDDVFALTTTSPTDGE